MPMGPWTPLADTNGPQGTAEDLQVLIIAGLPPSSCFIYPHLKFSITAVSNVIVSKICAWHILCEPIQC
jgi:hypothetical protein